MADQSRAAMVYDAKKKSLLIAYLLWLVLGWFGVHRFYAGRPLSGVLMLLWGGTFFVLTGTGRLSPWESMIGGVWWIVDAVLLSGIIRRANLKLIEQLVPQGGSQGNAG